MSREVVATPLFARRLRDYLDEYAEKGAVRFVEKLEHSYRKMMDDLATFEQIARTRRRTIGGKTIVVREYVLFAGARDFLVLYWIPPDSSEPVLLLNIRIGGQNRFRWNE